MLQTLLVFSIGIALLLFSTQKLVVFAERISKALRISPLIIGVTVVAIGTSLPELTVSIISILRHDTGLAIGNIIGSNIVNILMVLPAGILIGKLRIGTTKTQRNAYLLLGVTLLFWAIYVFGLTNSLTGLLLIVTAIIISIVEYKLGIFGRKHEDVKQFKLTNKDRLGAASVITSLFFIAGIILGGILVVSSVESISSITGITTTILGLTLTAIATSLPELLTTIFSQGDNQEKITIGNVLGSNIYNLLLVGGLITVFSPSATIMAKEWVWLLVSTFAFALLIRFYKGRTPPRIIGLILLIALALYLFTQ